MTRTARESVRADLADLDVRRTLSSVNAVLTLSLILTQSSSTRQVMRLVTTAVPSIVRCQNAMVWHPDSSGTYFERAPEGVAEALALLTAPGELEVDDTSSWWAFPLTSPPSQNPIFLIVASSQRLSDEDTFLLSVLAQLCGTVIARLELIAAERDNSLRVAALNAELASTVSTLTRIMEIHRRLNEIAAAGAGEQGIADALHQLTGMAVVIEDAHGNVRATSGDAPAESSNKQEPDARNQLIRELGIARRAVYKSGAWLALANPRADVVGVIRLIDVERIASETDRAALEYAATVLSLELGRLQSIAESELRSRRDLAEELLAGADQSTVKASARALGYDPLRPHRVIIATGRPQDGLDTRFFSTVVRHVRRLDAGNLVVARTNFVVIIAYRDVDWDRLQKAIVDDLREGGCRLAIGSRYDNAWQVAESYREAQFVDRLGATALNGTGAPVLSFESLGVYRMLSSVTDPSGIEAFMNQQLGPLIEYDAQHHADLVLTLARYFDNAANYDDTSAALSVHRNTLKYRLKRIREILGHDLHEGTRRLDLHLSTRIWLTLESLKRPSEP